MRDHVSLIDGHYEPLTAREAEVLNLVAQGLPSRQIATRLEISYATVRSHIRSVAAKLGAHSKEEAILKARQLALIR
ncbi:MAG TPA: helix-turn-helix transcriptional regulator [Candidatus Acidoferrum sp.]|nr:helix-turn-helix transcriptional regulator [Candidatus Acidoferrum sp.]